MNDFGGKHVREASSHFSLRGIYLRPNVFMINGTATHLMEVRFPTMSLNTASAAATATASSSGIFYTPSVLSATTKQPEWWGYQSPSAPTSRVSFDFAYCGAVSDFISADTTLSLEMASTEFREEELVQGFSCVENCALFDVWSAHARQLSISLRENRLSSPFQAEHLRALEKLVEQSNVVVFLGGPGAEFMPNNSVLPRNIDVALRAMRPGDEFAFIMFNPSCSSEDISSTYGTSGTSMSSFFTMRHTYTRIKLTSRIPCEPIMPSIVQKYKVCASPSTGKQLESGAFTPRELQRPVNVFFFGCLTRAGRITHHHRRRRQCYRKRQKRKKRTRLTFCGGARLSDGPASPSSPHDERNTKRAFDASFSPRHQQTQRQHHHNARRHRYHEKQPQRQQEQRRKNETKGAGGSPRRPG